MATAATSKFYTVVAGVGAGTGRSVALKFAKTYPVALLARNPANYEGIVKEINEAGGRAIGVSTDVSSPESVQAALASIRTQFKDLHLAAAIYNVGGKFIRKPFLEMSLAEYESGYEANGKGFFLFAQATLPLLLESVEAGSPHPPSLIITGATASLRGGAQMSSFASGKFALRATGQSLAREFGPKGVHVAHALIDGVIDIPRTKDWPVNGGAADGKISSEAIADSYWYLHTQPRSHFTQELDCRPYVEKF